MFFDIAISTVLNTIFYNSSYHSLYNCTLLTIFSLLKILFYENQIIHNLLNIAVLNSIFYYIVDTFTILKEQKINVFLIHHIFSVYILSIEYIFRYEVYTGYILLFLIELSSVSYNLYYYNFISKNTHICIYIPIRFVSSCMIIYYTFFELMYTYKIELILNIISYSLLVLFNIGGILKALNKM